RVLDADIVEGDVLHSRGVAVVDADGGAALDADDVDVLKQDPVNGSGAQLEADLERVAAGLVPQDGLAHGDVVHLAVIEVLHHDVVVVGTDEDVLHQNVARRDEVDPIGGARAVAVQDANAIHAQAIRAAGIEGPSLTVDDGDALHESILRTLQVDHVAPRAVVHSGGGRGG